MTIRIYVANLRAYNEGELKGDWFDLPVDPEEVYKKIFDKDEFDEQGNPMYDWAIHDYEAPFHINEYASIQQLSDIVEELQTASNYEKVVIDDNYTIADLISFADEISQRSHVEEFVPEVCLIEDLLAEIKEGNIFTVKNKLEGVTASSVYISSESDDLYYKLDGGGHYSTITGEDISNARKDILQGFIDEYK